ncbi:hypothetical protein V2J09_022026 [Rumex salicifolius]
MSCFPCFGKKTQERTYSNLEIPTSVAISTSSTQPYPEKASVQNGNVAKEPATNNIEAQIFTFKELANATNNFRQDCLIGEGGFGRVYKGQLERTSQVIVAIKQLDRNGLQGNKDFTMEVATLSQAHHPNLVNLIGYCADGEQRLLVYEFIPSGSLDKHAQPVFREPKRFPDLADRSLEGQFAVKSLNQVVAIAAMCLQEEETARPLMSDVVTALTFLSAGPTTTSQEESTASASPSSKVYPQH